MKKNLLLAVALLFLTNIYAQCWKQLDSGGSFTVGIKTDGTIWGWGDNSSGQVGGADEQVPTPIQIGNDNDWKVIKAGNGHVLALRNDNTLWAWGRNDSGQLGNNEITSNPNPTPIQIGTDNDWAFISAGNVFSTAIKEDGTLWTWGSNGNGELGNGSLDTSTPQTIVPTQVGTDTDWAQIEASTTQCFALKTDGTLWEWGNNGNLPLTNGANTPVVSPIQIGEDNNWIEVSAGGFGASAIKNNGTLWSWGHNNSGSVGDGTNIFRQTPVQIGIDSWKSVDRGGYFAGAIKGDGTLWTWGYNANGALGDGTTESKNSPTLVESEEKWVYYYGTGDFSVGLKTDGSLWVWGHNYDNTLGFNLNGDVITSPVMVEGECLWELQNQDFTIEDFTVYPNPTNGLVTISGTEDFGKTDVSIYNITGQLIKNLAFNNSQNMSIDLNDTASGIYFIEINTGTKSSKTIKVVKN